MTTQHGRKRYIDDEQFIIVTNFVNDIVNNMIEDYELQTETSWFYEKGL